MLDHLGERNAHDAIVAAIMKVLSSGDTRTPDMGGKASTKEMAAAIKAAIDK
jgi:tartrate dehydrogenase/decarboxylase/D-malate dehydrogenase